MKEREENLEQNEKVSLTDDAGNVAGLKDVVVSRPIRQLLVGEAVTIYEDSLSKLGVHPDDVKKCKDSFSASLESPRNVVAQRIDIAYQAKRAAQAVPISKKMDTENGLAAEPNTVDIPE